MTTKGSGRLGQGAAARGHARRERILEAATYFIARHGARGTSLAQIAKEAGVSQPGLIYHYNTKELLLHAVLDRRDESEQYFTWGDEDRPGLEVFTMVVDAVERWPEAPDMVGMHTVLVAENASEDNSISKRLRKAYEAGVDKVSLALSRAQEDGVLREDVDPRRKAMEILAFIHGLETAWLANRSVPAEEIAAQWAQDQARALRCDPRTA
ncbi:TetR/AcrR family transcriptional regulator [Glycomyces halotolerans]